MKLPTEFSDLECFTERWGAESYNDRWQARLSAKFEDLNAFYNAMVPRMSAIIEHLNRLPVNGLPVPEQALLRLAAAFMEVSIAVEIFHAPDEPGVFPASRFIVERFDSRAGGAPIGLYEAPLV